MPHDDRLPETAAVPATARRRHWGRALAVTGIVIVCAVPATDALAAGRGATNHRAARPIVKRVATRTWTATSTAVTTATPTDAAVDPQTGMTPGRGDSALKWWPWGPVVSGRMTRPTAGGWSTLVVQRGEITAIGDTTVTVTSADNTVITWTVGAGTALTGPAAPRRRHEPTSPRTAPTESPASGAASTTTATTTGLALHQQVGLWGTASGDTTTAQRIVVRTAPAPATSSTTSSTTTSTSTSTSTEAPTTTTGVLPN